MKRKIFTIISLSILIMACLALSSCGVPSPPSEKNISADLTEAITSQFIDNELQSLTIKKVTIDKRQTNKKEKTDYVYCTVEMKNDNFSFVGHYYCEYVYYDKGGWVLENYNESERSEVSAILGVTSLVTDMLNEELSGEYGTVELISQQMDISKQRDVITYKVYNIDDYSEVKGNIVFEFFFNGYEWEIASTEPQTTRTLLGGLTADDVLSLEQNFRQLYQDVNQTLRQTDLENGIDSFIYECVNRYPYLTEITTVTVNYSFYPNNSWTSNGMQNGKKTENWNIVGTWNLSGRVFAFLDPDTQKRIEAKVIVTNCSEMGCSGTYEITRPGSNSSTGNFELAFASDSDNFKYETNPHSLGQSPFIEISRKEGVKLWTVDRGYLESVTFTPDN